MFSLIVPIQEISPVLSIRWEVLLPSKPLRYARKGFQNLSLDCKDLSREDLCVFWRNIMHTLIFGSYVVELY